MNRTTLFLLLTFGICWSAVAIFALAGGTYKGIGGTILASGYMLVPAIAAIIVTWFVHREKIGKNLLISFKINRWFFVAWLTPPLLHFASMGIALLFPEVSYSPDMEGMFDRYEKTLTPDQMDQMRLSMIMMPLHPLLMAVVQGLLAGITINAVFGFGEELGWRGFLVRQLQARSFMKVSLIIGVIWGIWHAPLVLYGHNYPNYPVAGVFMMTAWCILLSPLFLYITLKSGSVIAAAIMHGTLNATVGIAIMMLDGGNELMVGATGLAGFIALTGVTLLFFLYDRYISRERIMGKAVNPDLNMPGA
ncbi:MAG: CPBP family intramembrane metalloprotease [Bacteroidales bacterium]|nr:CPBP family intramembrane metalloprotease [Bacteroidales bacterium]